MIEDTLIVERMYVTINCVPTVAPEFSENRRNYWAMHPSLNVIAKERFSGKRKMPRLRVIQKLLQLEIRDVYSTLPREVDNRVGNLFCRVVSHLSSSVLHTGVCT